MPSRLAPAQTRIISARIEQLTRLTPTGDSIRIAPTGSGTRPEVVRASTRSTSAQVKVPLSGCQRHQRQAAQDLARVSGVVVDVARLLNDDPAAIARERADREVVRQRSSRHEERALLAQQRREGLLHLFDASVKPYWSATGFSTAQSRTISAAASDGSRFSPSPERCTIVEAAGSRPAATGSGTARRTLRRQRRSSR